MTTPQRLLAGQVLKEFPGQSWNSLVDRYWEPIPPRQSGTGASHGPANAIPVLALNKTGEDVGQGAVLAIDGIAVNYDTNENIRYQTPLVKGIKYADGKQWGILQVDTLDDGVANLTIMGTAWCKIDVTDEAHNNAIPIVDDVDKLQSTDDEEAVSIIWKEDGTGEKWGIVLLGGGGGGGGASVTMGRTLEYIPAAAGYMTNEDQANWDPPVDPVDPDKDLKRPLKDVITVKKGKVWRLSVKPPPDPPDPLPPDWEEPDVELEDMLQEIPDTEPVEYEPVIEEWRNTLLDSVLKNSIVMGISFGGKTIITSVAPTTIKQEPE